MFKLVENFSFDIFYQENVQVGRKCFRLISFSKKMFKLVKNVFVLYFFTRDTIVGSYEGKFFNRAMDIFRQ